MIPTPETLAGLKQTLEVITQVLVWVKWGLAAGSAACAVIMLWIRRLIKKEARMAVEESTKSIDTSLFNIRKRMVKNNSDMVDRIKSVGDRIQAIGEEMAISREAGKTMSEETQKKYEIAILAFKEILKKSESVRQKDLQDFQKVLIDRYQTKNE